MENARERVYALMAKARASSGTRARSAAAVALLLAALLWFTKWPTLRPGLVILLAGQIGLILILVRHRSTISRELENVQTGNLGEDTFARWFEGQARFATRLAWTEDLIRTAGFLTLGYGFWRATGNILIAFSLGIVYPALAYFGMERAKHLRTKRMLQAERDAVIALAKANGISGSRS